MFVFEKRMHPGEFFLHGGWVMAVPVVVLITLLLLSNRKSVKTPQKKLECGYG